MPGRHRPGTDCPKVTRLPMILHSSGSPAHSFSHLSRVYTFCQTNDGRYGHMGDGKRILGPENQMEDGIVDVTAHSRSPRSFQPTLLCITCSPLSPRRHDS